MARPDEQFPMPDGSIYIARRPAAASGGDALVERSAGVSGAFIKELTRQAWLRGALSDGETPTGANLLDVLDELLQERSTLTRRLLGQPGDTASTGEGGPSPFPAMVHALGAAGLPLPPSVSAGG